MNDSDTRDASNQAGVCGATLESRVIGPGSTVHYAPPLICVKRTGHPGQHESNYGTYWSEAASASDESGHA